MTINDVETVLNLELEQRACPLRKCVAINTETTWFGALLI